MRTQAREAVLKLLFSGLFDNPAGEEEKNGIYSELKLEGEDTAFADRLYKNAKENFDCFGEEIAKLSSGFSLERIFKIDKCAMVIAMTEMKFEDVPKVVSIDEAVKLVKKYSTENSVNFVNGVLAAYKNILEA